MNLGTLSNVQVAATCEGVGNRTLVVRVKAGCSNLLSYASYRFRVRAEPRFERFIIISGVPRVGRLVILAGELGFEPRCGVLRSERSGFDRSPTPLYLSRLQVWWSRRELNPRSPLNQPFGAGSLRLGNALPLLIEGHLLPGRYRCFCKPCVGATYVNGSVLPVAFIIRSAFPLCHGPIPFGRT